MFQIRANKNFSNLDLNSINTSKHKNFFNLVLLACILLTINIFSFFDNILYSAIIARIRLLILFFLIFLSVLNNFNHITKKINQVFYVLLGIFFLLIGFMFYDHATEGIYLIGLCNLISLWVFGNIKLNQKTFSFLIFISISYIIFALLSKKQFYNNLIYLKLLFIDAEMNLNTFSQIIISFFLYFIILFDDCNINKIIKRLIELIILAIITYLIILSDSSNTLSGLIIMISLLILPNKIIKNKKFIILIIIILLIFPLIATNLVYKIFDIFKFLDISALSKRDVIWNKIWQEIDIKILFFGTDIQNIYHSGAHNFSLSLFFNFGLVFFVFYVLLFIDIINNLNFNKSKKLLCIAPILMLSLGLFEDFLMNPIMWAIMYPLLGFIDKNKREDINVFKHHSTRI